MSNIAQETAADVYHHYLEEAHQILEEFGLASHTESCNKMNILWNQLHMAGGAKYIYSDANFNNHSSEWLGSKGKHIIDELINDAKKSK